MFLIWQGLGALVAVGAVLVGGLVLTAAASAGVPADPSFIVAFLSMAACFWLVGRRLNDPIRDRHLVDPATGEPVVIRKRHSLFWIPVQWFAVAPAAMAILIVLDVIFDL